MKTTVLLLLLGTAPLLRGQILSVDISSGSSPTQSGFQAFTVATTDQTNAAPLTATFTGLDTSLTSGTVIASIASGATSTAVGEFLSRDRTTTTGNNGAFTDQSLYEDFVIAKQTSTAKLTLALSGLKASTMYSVTFYLYDAVTTGAATITNITGTGSQSGSVSWTAGTVFDGTQANENSLYSTTLTVQSDTSGNLVFLDSTTSGEGFQAILNGFQISAAAVPEPPTAWLMGVGFGVVALGLRRTLRRT